jgi:hypothetical protein
MKFTAPLVDAILAGISNRFDTLLTKKEMILAAVVHPQFKLRWLLDDAGKFNGKAFLVEAMKKAEVEMAAASAAAQASTRTLMPSVHDCDVEKLEKKNLTSTLSDDEDFFTFNETEPESVTSRPNALAEMEMFLTDGSRDLRLLHKYPLVKKVFISSNTGLPSSAAVERLFSLGGQILTPRRNRLSDEHFEMLVHLRANRSMLQE